MAYAQFAGSNDAFQDIMIYSFETTSRERKSHMIEWGFVDIDSTCTAQWFDYGYDVVERQIDKPSPPPQIYTFVCLAEGFPYFSAYGFLLFNGNDKTQINFFQIPRFAPVARGPCSRDKTHREKNGIWPRCLFPCSAYSQLKVLSSYFEL